ncbi:ATP synthase subunit d, mitochondrial [Trichomonascus vanleenenianus]|uniref:F1F0 ATP synthase subunit d n=1 Tax=Trichomonascus vanleenenianus TaxID=2268995 RepID=UPI003ECB009F
MSVARQASVKLDWAKVISTLGLTGATASSLLGFRKRHDEAKKVMLELEKQPTEVDFAHYKSVLKNQEIVNELEKAYKAFKPTTYDVSKQLKTIETFEAKALENAQATEKLVSEELVELQKTLDNIENARPFEQLTVADIHKARPEIKAKVDEMLKKGSWSVPGYTDKYPDLNLM